MTADPRYTVLSVRRNLSFFGVCVPVCLTLFVMSIFLSLSMGATTISFSTSIRVICSHLWPTIGISMPEGGAIIWNHRMPRVLLSALVGAALAVSGTTVQTAVRNHLADPYILGVSSGASFGAVLLLWLSPTAFHGPSLFIAAFCGGAVTSIAVYLLASRRGTISPQRLILAGVAMTYLLNSATSFVLLKIDRQNFGGSNNFLFWSMGSFARARWEDLPIPTIVLITGLFCLLAQGRVLDVMNLSDESALSMGVRPGAVRLWLFAVVSCLVASSVACVGQVGFIGLMIPHISRVCCGSNHRRNLSCAALIGAAFLLVADAFARTIALPQEIPVGVITAGCGAPFFLFLLRRH